MLKGMDKLGVLIQPKKAQRMCFQKRVFLSKNDARDFMSRGRKLGHNSSIVYQCPLCRKWHLTSMSKNDSAQARANVWRK